MQGDLRAFAQATPSARKALHPSSDSSEALRDSPLTTLLN